MEKVISVAAALGPIDTWGIFLSSCFSQKLLFTSAGAVYNNFVADYTRL